MNTAQFLTHSRGTFTALRFSPFVAVAILPFTFSGGLISIKLFISAIICAVSWLASLVMGWRSRNQFWFVASVLIVIFIPRLFGVLKPEVTNAQSFQWLMYLFIFTGLPLLALPTQMRTIARLNQTIEETEQDAPSNR